MIAIRWAGIVIFLLCMAAALAGARDWLLAVVGLASFLVVAWTCRSPRPTRPVSRWFGDIDDDHPEPLSRLDRLDGLDSRRPDNNT